MIAATVLTVAVRKMAKAHMFESTENWRVIFHQKEKKKNPFYVWMLKSTKFIT